MSKLSLVAWVLVTGLGLVLVGCGSDSDNRAASNTAGNAVKPAENQAANEAVEKPPVGPDSLIDPDGPAKTTEVDDADDDWTSGSGTTGDDDNSDDDDSDDSDDSDKGVDIDDDE